MRKQRGVTMIGWIFLLVPWPWCCTRYSRGPEYLNYYKVVTALKETALAAQGREGLSPAAILGAVDKRFDTGTSMNPRQGDHRSRGERAWTMTADYEKTVPMFANLYLLMVFKTTVAIELNANALMGLMPPVRRKLLARAGLCAARSRTVRGRAHASQRGRA
jgi:hypothetical protein